MKLKTIKSKHKINSHKKWKEKKTNNNQLEDTKKLLSQVYTKRNIKIKDEKIKTKLKKINKTTNSISNIIKNSKNRLPKTSRIPKLRKLW